ncbi:hypothetical protein OS493_021177 [Desmophyllum pertusum]|uniref:Uncharacterized protein n=1 Tax=Desmophyllum pertusum TaxID=174260 RepID=A0A9W9ZN19_9CNID|nr:hypothetical protein OS493_021177 [Desmophyllum pertusum]
MNIALEQTEEYANGQSKQVQSWVIPNISAILSDFQTIGEGLVKKIEVLNA